MNYVPQETYVSYAQNFEDVTLWRALKWFTPGFYIDVGANHPTQDSVTRAFYERGWHGINIEPVDAYHQALCRERPRDINLPVLVGDHDGEQDFYEVPESGLSSAVHAMVADVPDLGPPRRVQVRTLSSICEQHVRGDIHFLKIDVEGFEGPVLRGFDFARWRPWIIAIETPFNNVPEWASIITDAGYRKVRFDGINTFYLADEHAQLAGAFDIPPSYLDGFRLRAGHPFCELSSAAGETDRLRAERAEARVAEIEGSRWFRLGQRLHPLRRLLMR